MINPWKTWIRRFVSAMEKRRIGGGEGRKNGTKSGEHLGLALHRQGVFDVGTARRNA